MNRIARNVLILLILMANIGCDQVSKEIARARLDYHQPVEVLGAYFTLIKVENTGAFLSWGDTFSGPLRWIFMIILPIVILGAGSWVLFRQHQLDTLLTAGLCLVISGGLGNIVDRLLYGSVTDFMLLDFGLFRTGIFNLADVSIMIGMGLIIIDAFRTGNKSVLLK